MAMKQRDQTNRRRVPIGGSDRVVRARGADRSESGGRPRSMGCVPVLLLALVAGCATPRVESAILPGIDLHALDPVWVELQTSATHSGVAPDSPLAENLKSEVEGSLRARGHRIAVRDAARLVLVVGLHVDSVLRRSFSSDPDQGGTRAKRREEVVVALNAFARESGEELVRVESRALIPSFELPSTRDRDALWQRALDAALRELASVDE